MCHLGNLASSVTIVTCLLVCGRLLCGRAFKGRSAAQQRGRRRDLDHSNILAKSTFFSKLQTAALSFVIYVYLKNKSLLTPSLYISDARKTEVRGFDTL